MSKTLRNVGLAALLAISASALMSGSASALSNHDCSVKFKAAQAAGTDGGLSYKDFQKSECAADAAAPAAPVAAAPAAKAATAPAAATTAAAPAAKAMTKAPAAAATAVAPATTPSGSFMKDCSASWKAMKAANTVPAGMTWKDFVAAKCQVAAAPAAKTAPAAAAKAAPAAPAAAATAAVAPKAAPSVAPPEPADAADATPLATTDKNGKPFTAGQMAAHQRIRTCGDQYRTAKAANKLPASIMALDTKHRWPEYWSMCNKQLKAKGQ